MVNLIILGSGRSGTSLVTGLFAKAGYNQGTRLSGPNEGNPKGRFEDRQVNYTNEIILSQVMPDRPRLETQSRRSLTQRHSAGPAFCQCDTPPSSRCRNFD